MKHKWKTLFVVSLTACLFVISAVGCGSEPVAENQVSVSEPVGSADGAEPADSNTEKENTLADNTDTEDTGKWHVYDPDVAAAVDADFQGVVHRINTDSFLIAPTETTLTEDGFLMGNSYSSDAEIPDEELVQVVFDDNTVFTLRDIYDNGDRSEDSEASFEDIEKDLSIDLKGEFRGDVFHANAIRINKIH